MSARPVLRCDAVSPGHQFLQPNSFKASLYATKALRWLLQEVQAGSRHAQHNYGYLVLHGIGVEKSDELALQHFKLAAEQGNAYAQMSLVRFYDDGIIEETEPEEAYKLYKLAADSGNPIAQYQLGERLKKGLGVKANPKHAYKTFQAGAAQGYGDAIAAVGCCLLDGVGVAKDEVAAVAQLRLAVEQGSAMGMYWLETCFHRGLGVATPWEDDLCLRAGKLNYAPALFEQCNRGDQYKRNFIDNPHAHAFIADMTTEKDAEILVNLGDWCKTTRRIAEARERLASVSSKHRS
jgi:TPR repeat protein